MSQDPSGRLVQHVLGWQARFGGEPHAGWLPAHAAKPHPTPTVEAVLDIEILHDESGYFLVWESRNTEHAGDTWHETLEDAVDQARKSFGVRPEDWESVGSAT